MVNLTIYGKSSSVYEHVKQVILSTAEKAKIELDLNEIKDVQQFIRKDIMSIPAYQFNGKVYEKGKKTLPKFIKELQLDLLKKANYGELKIINVPTDFSESAQNAIDYASHLSQSFDSIIKLVHVIHPSPLNISLGYSLPELYDTKLNQLKSYINKISEANEEVNKNIIDADLKLGLAYDELINISEEDKENWIVMASTNTSKKVKNIFGSISISTAKNSSCPVFIIPPEVKFKPYKKIAMCINDDNIEAFIELCKIADPFESEIHLLNIYEPDSLINRDKLLNQINSICPGNRAKFFTLHSNDKIDAINDYCSKKDIDLLVLTRHKRGIFNDLLHKSFTKQILLNTELPLLVLHHN